MKREIVRVERLATYLEARGHELIPDSYPGLKRIAAVSILTDTERYRRIGSGAVLDTSDPRGMDVAENILQELYPAHSVQRGGGAMRAEAKPPTTLTPNTFNRLRHSSMAATNFGGSSFA
jgi:hypothetical protein